MSILVDILKEGLEKDLPKSVFLHNLYTLYQSNITLDDISDSKIASLASIDKYTGIPSEYLSSTEYRDLQIKNLYLKGIRKYPSFENKFYKISFSNSGVCKSSVFIGSNGVGKSSVFAALEKIGSGRMASAEFRGYKSAIEQNNYLRHANTPNDKCEIILETASFIRRYNLDNYISPLAYPGFFCMENDIVEISKGLNADYISRQLGLEDYLKLLKIFDDLIRERIKLSSNYETNVKTTNLLSLDLSLLNVIGNLSDIDSIKLCSALKLNEQKINNPALEKSHRYTYRHVKIALDILKSRDSSEIKLMEKIESIFSINLKQIFDVNYETGNNVEMAAEIETWKLLIKRIYNISADIISISSGTLLVNYVLIELKKKDLQHGLEVFFGQRHQLEEEAPLLTLENERYKDFMSVVGYLGNSYDKIINKVIEHAQNVFNTLMPPYFQRDIMGIKIEKESGGRRFNILIEGRFPTTGESMGYVDPRKYLNTFRFKLYCVAVKIALAFTCKIIYNLNFPIVIDDVFDASDFSNRERIKGFMQNIWKSHETIFSNEKPLQLIFFTQDDIIGDSIFRGIRGSSKNTKVKYSRIYNYYEFDYSQEPSKEILLDEEISVVNIEDFLQN